MSGLVLEARGVTVLEGDSNGDKIAGARERRLASPPLQPNVTPLCFRCSL